MDIEEWYPDTPVWRLSARPGFINYPGRLRYSCGWLFYVEKNAYLDPYYLGDGLHPLGAREFAAPISAVKVSWADRAESRMTLAVDGQTYEFQFNPPAGQWLTNDGHEADHVVDKAAMYGPLAAHFAVHFAAAHGTWVSAHHADATRAAKYGRRATDARLKSLSKEPSSRNAANWQLLLNGNHPHIPTAGPLATRYLPRASEEDAEAYALIDPLRHILSRSETRAEAEQVLRPTIVLLIANKKRAREVATGIAAVLQKVEGLRARGLRLENWSAPILANSTFSMYGTIRLSGLEGSDTMPFRVLAWPNEDRKGIAALTLTSSDSGLAVLRRCLSV